MKVSIQAYNRNFIDFIVKEVDAKEEWRYTLFYGDLVANRHATWELLKGLHQDPDAPWVISSDFNEGLSNDEKKRAPRSKRQMMAFKKAIDECGMLDLGFSGYRFTWGNGRGGEANVQERLDRFVGNIPCMEHFAMAQMYTFFHPLRTIGLSC